MAKNTKIQCSRMNKSQFGVKLYRTWVQFYAKLPADSLIFVHGKNFNLQESMISWQLASVPASCV